MNSVKLTGRPIDKPDVRYTDGANPMCIAKYTLAVDRTYKRDGEQKADFIRCVAFGSNGVFAEKYIEKGKKYLVEGRIQTGSYVNKDGVKVYTTEVVVERHEFCESNQNKQAKPAETKQTESMDDFMNIPDGIDDELPFA